MAGARRVDEEMLDNVDTPADDEISTLQELTNSREELIGILCIEDVIHTDFLTILVILLKM